MGGVDSGALWSVAIGRTAIDTCFLACKSWWIIKCVISFMMCVMIYMIFMMLNMIFMMCDVIYDVNYDVWCVFSSINMCHKMGIWHTWMCIRCNCVLFSIINKDFYDYKSHHMISYHHKTHHKYHKTHHMISYHHKRHHKWITRAIKHII